MRVFGKHLRLPSDAEPLLVLVQPGGEATRLAIAASNPYSLEGMLPPNLPPGTYRVQAHNGTGGP